MLDFTHRDQRIPDVTPAAVRRMHFDEIYAQFAAQDMADQASRCSQCGIPFCQIHCPLQNNIPDWLKLAAEGRLEEAYRLSSATNNFPEICGRICPQDRLCEGNCVIEKDFGSVTIGAIERAITETAFAAGWVTAAPPKVESGKRVAIIGAGPAGLAAADMLRMQGHAVSVYDRYDRTGGLLVYGIPNFKLEKQVVARRHALLAAKGIVFHHGQDIGRTLPLAQLRAEYDAVLIATGVYQPRNMDLPEYHLAGVIPALDYLTTSNRIGLGDAVSAFEDGSHNAAGKHVVVVGGGDTAMDCVRTAVRQGAAKVTCLYRRDRANMPGSMREVKNAEEEGVEFAWLSAPKALTGSGGRVEQLLVQRMRLGSQDRSGRATIVPVEGDGYQLKADMVITALGFDPEPLPQLFNAPELTVTSQGTLKVGANFETSLPGVFAAGDIVRGASLVVWAIRDGRDAAEEIHKYMSCDTRRAA